MAGHVTRCPACQLAAPSDARWCERCGQAIRPASPAGFWRSSTAASAPCAGCGSGASDNGYCGECGQRRLAALDRAAIDFGVVAGATDRGRRRSRNEDAFAIGRHGSATVAVVCDGVASAPRSDQAAVAAAEAGVAGLLRAVAGGASAEGATEAAGQAAAGAAAAVGEAVAGRHGGSAVTYTGPPSCTYVSALVTPERVVVGWVGDSRAYWVGPGEARTLTVDHTLAGQLAAEGAPADDERHADPLAVALLRWLGADAEKPEPEVRVFDLTPPAGLAPPGLVVVCSDGLSRYLSSAYDLLALWRGHAAPGSGPTPSRRSPAAFAAALVRHAVDAGGIDNIAVAVLPCPPSGDPPPPEPRHHPEPQRGAEPQCGAESQRGPEARQDAGRRFDEPRHDAEPAADQEGLPT